MADNLEHVYEHMNIDLMDKVPVNVAELCRKLGKTMKQDPTTILLSLLSMFSVAIGNATIKVNSRWKENVQLWMVLCMRTGRGKSTIHKFVSEIMDRVVDNLKGSGALNVARPGSDIIMPHCTWEKFGEILAINGCRILGLYDEMMSFLASANLYSSGKGKTSNDTNQSEFLTLFNGGSKRRETITGNANYNMKSTHVTILGFTQPDAAEALINDSSTTNTGFANRFLWYFPRPNYAYFNDLEITDEEQEELNNAISILAEALTDVYREGEKFCRYENAKVLTVEPSSHAFKLSTDAKVFFSDIHNTFEDITRENANNNFMTGLYSRGKSQILRMACVVEVMNYQIERHCQRDEVSEVLMEILDLACSQQDGQNASQDEIKISQNSIKTASELVQISLSQLAEINGQNVKATASGTKYSEAIVAAGRAILKIPGKMVSGIILVRTNKFRALKKDITNSAFIQKVFEELEKASLGKSIKRLANNNSTIYYFQKTEAPEAESLLHYGVAVEEFTEMYSLENEESKKHELCYQSAKKRKKTN